MNIEIRNSQGERIDHTFHGGAVHSDALVVIGHGVTGNKDRPFLVALAEALAEAGVPALRISFSGNGSSEGRFTDSNITREVSDLGAVLDAVQGRFKTLGYIGHSMGGAVGVMSAAVDPRLRFLVSLAGMVNTAAFAEREFGMVTPGAGFMWDDENCPLSQAYMDDLRGIQSLTPLAGRIRVPWLLVHGSEDDVVPPGDSREIFAAAHEPKQLVEIPGSNHVFAGDPTARMIGAVVPWVVARLKA